MAKTIVALYEDFSTAQRVVEALISAGLSRDEISVMASDTSGEYSKKLNTSSDDVSGGEGAGFGAVMGALIGLGAMIIPGIGPVIGAGPLLAGLIGAGVGAAAGAATGGLVASMVKLGIDEESAGYYAEGVRRGGTLVVAHVDDRKESDVMRIMNQYNPVDVHERSAQWRESSTDMTGNTSNTPYSSTDTDKNLNRTPRSGSDKEKLEVVEETLDITKREVEKGGVRAHTIITETPVQKEVHLREEHVHVDRRPVNRPATDADFRNTEETIELTERAEVPVINKEAHVVEEVVLSKDVEERTETVTDTVRRKDVEIENIDSDYSQYESGWRSHYSSNYGTTGRDYSYYAPAYQYGHSLATDNRYSGFEWEVLESDARRNWESHNMDNPWEDFRDAVRHSWQSARGKR